MPLFVCKIEIAIRDQAADVGIFLGDVRQALVLLIAGEQRRVRFMVYVIVIGIIIL